MKGLTLVVLFNLSTFIHLTAQTGKVSGILLGEDKQPAAFVSVVLLDQDSALVKGAVSNVNGEYQLVGVQPGTMQLQTQSVEFADHTTDFFTISAGESKQIPVISLSNSTKQLDAVEISATRPMIEVQPDKTVFNVENSPNAIGADGMELLRKSPGVTIDNNDNIILSGKNGVMIYVDDKPLRLAGDDLVAYLRGLQSDQIESIEIITSPSSKYDAEGNAGIINIRLKRDKNLGTNANITTGYSVGKRYNLRGGGSLNHREKRFSAFASYNFYNNLGWSFINTDREQFGGFFESSSDEKWDVNGHGFRVGGDYYLGKKHTLGVAVNGYINDNVNSNDSRTAIGSLATMNSDSILIANNRGNRNTSNMNYNLNYVFRGENGSRINIDLDYGRYESDGETFQPNEYINPESGELMSGRYFTNIQVTDIDIKTAKIDYETNLGSGRFSAGTKIANVLTDNSFEQYNETNGQNTLEERSADFEYTERVWAVYSNYNVALGDRVNFSGGLRMEHTYSNGDLDAQLDANDNVVKREYTNFFPSGGITFKANEQNQLGFNYSRRINRPNYQDLNPFEYQLDELTFRKGNPFLNPQYSQNFQVTHTWRSMINTRASYSYTSDFFAQVIEAADNNRGTLLQQQNLATAENYSLNISAPINIAKWWSTYTSFTLTHAAFDSKVRFDQLNVSVTSYNVYAQNNFMLPKGFKLEVSGWYNSPSVWGGTFLTSRIYAIEAGLQKSLFNDRGTLSLGVSDIFLTQRWQGDSDYNGVIIDANGGWDSRRFKASLSIRLGNNQVRLRNRKSGLEDEASRISNN